MITLLLADIVAPISSPPIIGGGVLFEQDTVLAVGDKPSLTSGQHPRPDHIERLTDTILLPGLINAHTHLELTGLGPPAQPCSFVDWVLKIRGRLLGQSNLDEFLRQSFALGVAQCLRSGVTTIGDVTANPIITRPLMCASRMRGISFGEVLGMAGRRAQFQPRLEAALRSLTVCAPRVRAGIEPHAPYSTELPYFRQCAIAARDLGIPLCTHLAETPHETEFLKEHTGELKKLWDALGSWTDDVPTFHGGPIRAMQEVGLLDVPAIVAHANYVDDDELDLLAKKCASVVFCPRTHLYFGHVPHRWREMLARGINVAVGTDSAASSPDLNIVEDLRLLHRQHPDIAPEELWALVTTRAAKAMGMGDQVGSLEPGKRADFCTFPRVGAEPLREILEGGAECSSTWISGQRLR